MDLKYSYTSANNFPLKIFKNLSSLKDGNIYPCHAYVNLTNICNLSCEFCCFKNREKNLEMQYDKFITILQKLKKLNCKAITFTGGGEPLVCKYIQAAVSEVNKLNIKIGIVTNGLLLNKFESDFFNKITWIRISLSYEKEFNTEYISILEKAIKNGKNVDWGFSYIFSNNIDFNELKKVSEYANKHNFTHIRFLPNIKERNAKNADEKFIMQKLKEFDIDDSLFILRPDFHYKGQENCLVGLLRPVIDVDGSLYSCCGISYANDIYSDKFDKCLSFGNVDSIEKIYSEQKAFNGIHCKYCYYNDFNTILNFYKSKIKHSEFV